MATHKVIERKDKTARAANPKTSKVHTVKSRERVERWQQVGHPVKRAEGTPTGRRGGK